MKKTRRDYSCRWDHMESGSSNDAHGVSQIQCTWRFDAPTNSRWWRIFAKVEFVRVVSNIIQGRLQLDLVWTVRRQGRSCVLIEHLYPRPLIYIGGRHTM